MKIAKIKPVFKKGVHDIVDNYRPISILPALSKIFEKVAYIQFYDYLVENKLLYAGQYGFRKNHSTELASIEFIDHVIHKLDKSKFPLSVLLDLSRAFDTLDHSILLHKLKYYGADGPALDWFHSYLCNRTQCVQIDDSLSSPLPVTTGVPQGSILGPLLFILYVNDICSVSNRFYPILYADDTTLISTLCVFDPITGNNDDRSIAINRELGIINTWLEANKLSLNATKQNIWFSIPLIAPKIHYRF